MADPQILEDSEATAEQGSKAKKKGLSVNPLLIAAVAAVLISLLAAFFLVRLLLPRSAAEVEPGQEPAARSAGESAAPKKNTLGELYSFERPIVVNLAGTNAERYLKVIMVLELETATMKPELKLREPQILDLLINILSNKTLEDISSTAGRNMVRQEIIDKINALLESGRVRTIYFTEFVVQ